MRNGKDSCLFGEELVSYIYDELPTSERHSFEGHLLNCSSCTAEFAELSMSHLGVYEWHRDEFVPLETPQFVIPYAPPKPTVWWVTAVRGFIFTPSRLSFAGGALAILVAAFGALYMADSNSNGLAEIQVQQAEFELSGPQKAVDIAKTEDEGRSDNSLEDKDLGGTRMASGSTSRTTVRRIGLVRTKAVKKSADRQFTAREKRPANAPRLGTFDEVEDTSLRLADLVADIDSYRK